MTKETVPLTSETCFNSSPFHSTKHSTYFPVYDVLFSKYRGKPITFVEVGILEGGSLFMWRAFFGEKARIIGVDVNPNAKKWEKHGFEIFIGSQSSPEFWEDFFEKVGDVDVLLDDGGHTYVQQIITSEMALDHIKDDGMLVVEDTHTSYMNAFGDRRINFIDYCKIWIDRINLRFGPFATEQTDRRVWSLEFFESFAAFKVNRPFSHQKSFMIFNDGERDFAQDFRNDDPNFSKENLPRIKEIVAKAFDLFR